MRSDPETAESDPPLPSKKRHREVLGVAIGVVILSFLLEVRDDQRVFFRGFSRYPIPELCTVRSWFGTTCPGCGLTRGIIHVAHADWSAALEIHRLSFLMAFAILIQIPYRIQCLRTGRPPLGRWIPRLFGSLLIASLLINWLIGVAYLDRDRGRRSQSQDTESGHHESRDFLQGSKSIVGSRAIDLTWAMPGYGSSGCSVRRPCGCASLA